MNNQIKEKIEMQLFNATSFEMSPEQTSYAAGLADALEIIKAVEQDQLKLGKEYYVLVWNENNRTTIVEKRVLSKITNTVSRTSYCFSINSHDTHPIVLYSKGGLASRVFDNYEDAVRNKRHVYLDQKIQY